MNRPRVIEVTVREQNRFRLEFRLREELHERLGGVLTRIDDDALPRVVVREM